MRDELIDSIRAMARETGEGQPPSISLADVRLQAERHGVPPLEVEIAALEAGVVPARYLRNIGTLGIAGQLKLLRSCAGVLGLGGLGGYAALFLARFGTGRLIIADGDVFGEDNLNRQNLCSEADLGRPKAERAKELIAAVNSSLQVTAHHRFLGAGEVEEVFAGADVVVDALDNVSSRLALQEGCRSLGVPMVHGAIAGDSGQVMTIYPGDPGLESLYQVGEDRGVEMVEGNPPTTPALVAAIQAREAVKVICGGETLRHGFLLIDTASNLFQFIPLA